MYWKYRFNGPPITDQKLPSDSYAQIMSYIFLLLAPTLAAAHLGVVCADGI